MLDMIRGNLNMTFCLHLSLTFRSFDIEQGTVQPVNQYPFLPRCVRNGVKNTPQPFSEPQSSDSPEIYLRRKKPKTLTELVIESGPLILVKAPQVRGGKFFFLGIVGRGKHEKRSVIIPIPVVPQLAIVNVGQSLL
jgi:hypothetical protein